MIKGIDPTSAEAKSSASTGLMGSGRTEMA